MSVCEGWARGSFILSSLALLKHRDIDFDACGNLDDRLGQAQKLQSWKQLLKSLINENNESVNTDETSSPNQSLNSCGPRDLDRRVTFTDQRSGFGPIEALRIIP